MVLKIKSKQTKKTVWIIGGSSTIGRALCKSLHEKGVRYIGTSRKKSSGMFFLDLAKKIPDLPLKSVDQVVLLAGLTDMRFCEKNKKLAKRINYTSVIKIAEQCAASGCHFVFLSSSRVFSGHRKKPWQENSLPKAFNFYGHLKLKCEKYLKTNVKSFAILRLSKIITKESETEKNKHWAKKIKMAPVSIQEVINSILQILIKRAKGTFHLSSKNACSYYEFYKRVTGQAFIKDKKNLKNYWKENPIII